MSNKTRVLQVIGGMYLGGAERVVSNIVTHLDSDKYDLVIYCIHGVGELGEDLISRGYKVELLGRNTGILETLVKIKKYINSYKPHIIHTHTISAFLAIGPLAVLTNLPKWIHTFHFGNYPHIKRSYLYSKRIFGRFAAKLVTVSDSQRTAVIKYLSASPSKTLTIFNGVHVNSYIDDPDIRYSIRDEFGYGNNDIVLACIVVFTEQKGLSYLLQSIDKTVDKIPNMKLLLVGGGPLEAALKKQASELKHKDVITFAGWRKDIQQIMCGVDAFVLPSLWEGLPMVLLEAMASKLPVVVTDVADNLEVVGQGIAGYVVPPADASALSDATVELLSDMVKAKIMGVVALKRFQESYTVDIMVSNYDKLYQELLH